MRYTIQNINVWSAFKFGTLIGCIWGFFPGFTLGLTLRSMIHGLVTWLQSWLVLDLPLLGSFSLLDAVNLQEFLSQLQRWDRQSWLLMLLLTLLSIVVGGVVAGVLSALAAVIYNVVAAVSGGIVVQADTLDNASFALTPAPPNVASSVAAMPGNSFPAPDAIVPKITPPNKPSPHSAPDKEADGWLIAQATQQRFPVGRGETRLGSGADNQIVLAGLAVHHAAIRWENGRFILYDYSEGQTWVNGRSLVGPNMIKAGFQIRLGNQEFLFQV